MLTHPEQPSVEGRSPTQFAIGRELRRRLGREWQVGSRLPPIKELARQLGAGQNNTNEVVRELAREGLLHSRQRQGTFVVKVPKHSEEVAVRSAPTLSLSGRTVALHYQGPATEGFIQRMVDGFASVVTPQGATIVTRFLSSRGTIADPDPSADAIVMFNPGNAEPLRCREHQLLSVATTAIHVPVAMSGGYDLVSINEHQGGVLGGEALRAAGCQRVCFVGAVMPNVSELRYDATSALRLIGFEAGWGCPLDAADLLYAQGYSTLPGGMAFGKYMALESKPDGVFAASDDLAIGFTAAAASHGMLAGRDFQIVGFDGQDRGQSMGGITLTTVKVPAAEMGRRAAMLLIERFAQRNRPVHRLQLDCTLHQGTTTRDVVVDASP